MFSRDTFSAAQLNQASFFGLHFTSLWRIVNAQVQIRTGAYASRLERRLIQIEKLDAQAKRQIARIRDTFIEREKLKQCVRAQETATS